MYNVTHDQKDIQLKKYLIKSWKQDNKKIDRKKETDVTIMRNDDALFV